MSENEISPEIVALRERWKDASDEEVLAAYDADEPMDAETFRRCSRLLRKREEQAEGEIRFQLGRYCKTAPDRDVAYVELRNIHIPPGRRPLQEDRVTELMESIRSVGLLHPPILIIRNDVEIEGENYDSVPVLVAGRHRLEAWRRLGHSTIACLKIVTDDLDAALIEIAENLHRAELTALERDEQIARWIELTSAKSEISPQPVAKLGRPESGVRAAARGLGINREDARRAVKVASLSPEAKVAAVKLGVDDNRTALLAAAAEIEPEKQVEALMVRTIVAANQNGQGAAAYRTSFTGNNEWYTPSRYIELARSVLGQIDVDPASNDHAQKTVRSAAYYTIDNSGLDKEWHGKVWMNPPYSQPEIVHFIEKVIAEYESGRCTEAIVLTHNSTDTAWADKLFKHSSAICFTTGRVRFESPEGEKAAPAMGQMFTYFGPNPERFSEVFREVGNVVSLLRQVAAAAEADDDFTPPVRTPIGRDWEQDEAA